MQEMLAISHKFTRRSSTDEKISLRLLGMGRINVCICHFCLWLPSALSVIFATKYFTQRVNETSLKNMHG